MDYCNIDDRDVMIILRQWQNEDRCNRSFLLVMNSHLPFGYNDVRTASKHGTMTEIKDLVEALFNESPYVMEAARDIIREHDEMENKAKRKDNDTTGTI